MVFCCFHLLKVTSTTEPASYCYTFTSDAIKFTQKKLVAVKLVVSYFFLFYVFIMEMRVYHNHISYTTIHPSILAIAIVFLCVISIALCCFLTVVVCIITSILSFIPSYFPYHLYCCWCFSARYSNIFSEHFNNVAICMPFLYWISMKSLLVITTITIIWGCMLLCVLICAYGWCEEWKKRRKENVRKALCFISTLKQHY